MTEYTPDLDTLIEKAKADCQWEEVEDYEICPQCTRIIDSSLNASKCRKCIKRWFYENYELNSPREQIH